MRQIHTHSHSNFTFWQGHITKGSVNCPWSYCFVVRTSTTATTCTIFWIAIGGFEFSCPMTPKCANVLWSLLTEHIQKICCKLKDKVKQKHVFM